MGIGTKGVHVSELKYKTCPARWIYFCVGVFPGSCNGVLASNSLPTEACQCLDLEAAAHERPLDLRVALAYIDSLRRT